MDSPLEVLCVGDHAAAARTAGALERSTGRFETRSATSAEAALEGADSSDCVVLDVSGPGGPGVSLVEPLSTSQPSLPVVVVVGSDQGEAVRAALDAGAADCVHRDAGWDCLLAKSVRDAVTSGDARPARLEALARRYEAIFENPLTLIGLLSPDGTVIEVNGTATEMVDAPDGRFVGVPFPETPWWSHSESLQAELRTWLDRAADGEYVRYESQHPTGDGGTATVDGLIHPVEDADGEVTELVAVARDISQREAYERTIESLHEVATEMSTLDDETAVVERTVEAAESVLSFDRSVVSEARGDRLVPVATSEGLSPEEVTTMSVDEGVLGRSYRTGETLLVEDLQSHPDAEPQGPYGAAVTVPVGDDWMLQSVASEVGVFDDRDRKLAEMLAAHAGSVLDRLRRERQMSTIREQLGFTLDATDSLAWTIDVDAEELTMVRGSPGQLFGFETGETVPVERFIEDGIHPDDRGKLDDTWADVLDGERDEFTIEFRPHPAVDDDRWVAATGYRTSADPTRVVGLTTDVTELKEREQELRRQNERLAEFAAVVSHDLRAPLNVAMGRAEMLSDEDHGPAIADALDRMDALVKDLLALAKDGADATTTEPVDLGARVRDCWTTAGTTDGTLHVESPGTVLADPDRLSHLLTNLLRNAVDHAGDGVTVTVGGTDDGFFVADDGPGIPADERETVFESGHTTTNDGTGFGLTIVEQVAEAHGWTVEVAESAGGGARFDVRDVRRP